MKTLLLWLTAIIILFSPIAFAQDAADATTGTPTGATDVTTTFAADVPDYLSITEGITPDSPLYFLDTAWDSFQIALAVSPDAEATVTAQVSAERLVEAHAMLEAGDYDGAQVAMEGADAALERFATAMEDATLELGDLADLETLAHYTNQYA